jgi:hypothetical protein
LGGRFRGRLCDGPDGWCRRRPGGLLSTQANPKHRYGNEKRSK